MLCGQHFGLFVDFRGNPHSDYCGLCRHVPTIAHMTTTATERTFLEQLEVRIVKLADDARRYGLAEEACKNPRMALYWAGKRNAYQDVLDLLR